MAERAPRVDILFGLSYPDSRVQRTAQALSDAGYEVRVLAWDRSGSLPRRTRDGAVRIEHARVTSRGGRGWTQFAYLLRAVAKHLPAMRRDRADIIHAVDLPMLAIAIVLRPLLGWPRLVYDAFEVYALMEAHKYPPPVLWMIDALERRLPRWADLVITPGDARREYFAARGIESVVVGNWIDPPHDPVSREEARRDLAIETDRFCVAYVGGLEPSRDLGALVRAARASPADLFLIAGRGEQEAELRSDAAALANLRFLGWLPDPGPVFAAADAIYYALDPAHPYAAHPAPNTLYAAIAWRVPLVHRGQGEVGVVASGADIGVRFGDDASLARALEQLRDPERQHHIRSSLGALQARYNAAAAARALLDAYPSRAPARASPR